MRALAFAGIFAGSAAAAQDFAPVAEDAAITALLAGQVVVFDAYTYQSFGADGRTQFVTERMADGLWEARDGRYCSQWPPSERWDCYDLSVDGQDVRFTSDTGVTSAGVIAP